MTIFVSFKLNLSYADGKEGRFQLKFLHAQTNTQ